MMIVGNWKMNGSLSMAKSLVEGIADGLPSEGDFEAVVCPPSPYITAVAGWVGDAPIGVGAQGCHSAESGAHTGDVAATMLADCGASYVIVGHSERRQDHGETDAAVKAQAEAALKADLCPIICVGETQAEREAGRASDVVLSQLRGSVPDGVTANAIVIAYEPVWAIGTGLTPSIEDIAEIHAVIAAEMVKLCTDDAVPPLLYGGSVKPGNAKEILAIEHVDGGLIGGASLKAEDFLGIIRAGM